jgi:cytoskeletal protein CcmA (bactofilin family)
MVCIMPFLIFSSLHAQQGTEWKTQGNTADTNSFIGTTNASSLILRSNDVERMRINENGNVGIGVNEPNEKLHVSGTVRIDSVLYARDSLVVGESGYIQGDLEVEGNITVRQGALRVKSLIDTSISENGVLKVNEEGEIVNGGDLKYNVYKEIEETYHCAKDDEGGIIYEAAYWQNDPQRIFILNSRCKPDVKLGVGVKPEAKFHIRTNNNSQVHPLVIEKLSN